MAYDVTGLVPIGGQSKAGNAPQIFAYKTTDAHAAVDTSGYFNSAAGVLKPGDVILVTVMSGASVSTAGFHVVLTNTGSVVNVSDVTALTVTNTD